MRAMNPSRLGVVVAVVVASAAGSAPAAEAPESPKAIADRFVHSWAHILSALADLSTAFTAPKITPVNESTFVVTVPNRAQIDLTLTFDPGGWIKLAVSKSEPKLFAVPELVKDRVKSLVT